MEARGSEPVVAIEELSAEACRALLATVPVGWLAHCTDDGVHMVPVNFTVHQRELVVRAAYGQTLSAAVHHRPMTFAAGAFDAAARTGWSVTVRGTAQLLGDDLVNPGLSAAEVWAEPARTVTIGLPLTAVSGRRVWVAQDDGAAPSAAPLP